MINPSEVGFPSLATIIRISCYKIAQQVKALAKRRDDTISISKTHIVEDWPSQVAFTCVNSYAVNKY